MPKQALIKTDASTEDETKRRIIKGARQCFRKHGVSRISIEDIAKASHIARSGVYRYFTSRREIVEVAVIERLNEMMPGFRSMVGAAQSFADALVQGCLVTIDAGRNDSELRQMLDSSGDVQFTDMLTGSSPISHYMMLNFWEPIFSRGTASGEMRGDVSFNESMEWIHGVLLMLVARNELDIGTEKKLLETFFLASMLSPVALEARRKKSTRNKPKMVGAL